MTNYEAVEQWAATFNADKALKEITTLKEKYPWLKCDETIQFVKKMQSDLPKIVNMIKAQEKLKNSYSKALDERERFIELNQMADEAIIMAVAGKYHPELE
jgi:hypothetical protein